jgi:membrane fusion protein (multidrug efflux system)
MRSFLISLKRARGERGQIQRTAAIALAFLLLAVSCKNSGTPPGAGRTPEVAVVAVRTQRITLTTELPGRTSAYRVAEIRPQVSGLIQKRLFTEGTDVPAGYLLYQIDPAPFQAVLDNALAALSRAEANLPPVRARAQRFKELLADKSVSQQDYDDADGALKLAEADVKFAKAAVETARINLEYTRINAPIGGRIGRSTITDGAIVTAYQPMPLAVVQQLDPIYVDVTQSTKELLRLQKRLAQGELSTPASAQSKVWLILEDGTAYTHEGTLQFRDISVDPTTATVVLRMVFPNPQGILLPGMFVRTIVEEGTDKNAILVPQQSVMRDPKGQPQVLVVDANGSAQVKMLELDRAIGDQWVVSAGLTPGEQIIVEGAQRVRPGTPVKAVPFTPGSKDSVQSEGKPPVEQKQN